MIRINGVEYPDGHDVTIINGEVTVDGIKQGNERLNGVVRVEVTGDLKSLTSTAPVKCENVLGDVFAEGPVTCKNVGGSVRAEGTVNCGNVLGKVNAEGPVVMKG